MSNTSAMRSAWAGQLCKNAPLASFTFHGGTRINVNQHILDAMSALDYVMAHYGYQVRSGETGAYNCRAITGGTNYSLHAYAIAVDINWSENPYQTPAQYAHGLKTDMPRAMVNDILKIRTANNKQVWGWGGDYTGNKDPMHYEIHVTPADLATGIVGVSFDQNPIHPPNPTPDPVRPEALIMAGVFEAVAQNQDGRWETFKVESTALRDSWQTSVGGPFSSPWVSIDTTQQWVAGSLRAVRGNDGRINVWGLRVSDNARMVVWQLNPNGVGGWSPPLAFPA